MARGPAGGAGPIGPQDRAPSPPPAGKKGPSGLLFVYVVPPWAVPPPYAPFNLPLLTWLTPPGWTSLVWAVHAGHRCPAFANVVTSTHPDSPEALRAFPLHCAHPARYNIRLAPGNQFSSCPAVLFKQRSRFGSLPRAALVAGVQAINVWFSPKTGPVCANHYSAPPALGSTGEFGISTNRLGFPSGHVFTRARTWQGIQPSSG